MDGITEYRGFPIDLEFWIMEVGYFPIYRNQKSEVFSSDGNWIMEMDDRSDQSRVDNENNSQVDIWTYQI